MYDVEYNIYVNLILSESLVHVWKQELKCSKYPEVVYMQRI